MRQSHEEGWWIPPFEKVEPCITTVLAGVGSDNGSTVLHSKDKIQFFDQLDNFYTALSSPDLIYTTATAFNALLRVGIVLNLSLVLEHIMLSTMAFLVLLFHHCSTYNLTNQFI